MKYFIQGFVGGDWEPNNWFIVGEEDDVMSEELALLFNSMEEAREWIDEQKQKDTVYVKYKIRKCSCID